MTLTFLELYNECAGQPWSMYDNDAESIDDLESALKISINKALAYIWNYQAWSFRFKTHIYKLKTGKAEYTMPNGNIYRHVVKGETVYNVRIDGKRLDYIDDYDDLEAKEGTPEGFYVKGETICVYPTPDEPYVMTVDYLSLPFGLNEDGEQIYSLEQEEDYVDIPEKYEDIFKNCLISKAMLYAIADESDENYSGYENQYNDALGVLLKYCKNNQVDKNIVI